MVTSLCLVVTSLCLVVTSLYAFVPFSYIASLCLVVTSFLFPLVVLQPSTEQSHFPAIIFSEIPLPSVQILLPITRI